MPGLLINIDVPDIEPGIAFYTAALGLRVGRRFREDFVELLGTDAPIYLLRNAAGTSIGPAGGDVRRYERHWSPIHPDFVVEDMDAAIARATAAGAVQAVLDTGARGTIMNWAAAKLLGLTPESPGLATATPVKGVSQHGTQSFAATFGSLAIGEASVARPALRIADLPVFGVLGFRPDEPALILGIDMLADRRFVVDYPAKQLHISPPIAAGSEKAPSGAFSAAVLPG